MSATGPDLLVCFAVAQEAAPFRRQMRRAANVRVLITGMGQRQAEHAIAAELGQHVPQWVISSGFAGALNPALAAGTVLFETTSSPSLRPALVAAGAQPGRFHCAARVITTAPEKRALWEATRADAVEMESAFIHAACRARNVPCVTLRAISDAAAEDLPLDFNRLLNADQRLDYYRLAAALAKSPRQLGPLLRFQQRLRRASEALAQVLFRVVMGTSTAKPGVLHG